MSITRRGFLKVSAVVATAIAVPFSQAFAKVYIKGFEFYLYRNKADFDKLIASYDIRRRRNPVVADPRKQIVRTDVLPNGKIVVVVSKIPTCSDTNCTLPLRMVYHAESIYDGSTQTFRKSRGLESQEALNEYLRLV
jgi:hypothetical protein